MKKVLITGSSGLIGSEAVSYFDERCWEVHGVGNNLRAYFFGPDGDTTWNLERLRRTTKHFQHHDLDIRQRQSMIELIQGLKPDLLIHSAAQPSTSYTRRPTQRTFHSIYISDERRIQTDYPEWGTTPSPWMIYYLKFPVLREGS